MVKEAWVEGLSAQDIADKLPYANVTRRAVLGLYGRYPELRRTHPLNFKFVAGADSNIVGYGVVGFTREEANAYDAKATGMTLLELENWNCKWPVGQNSFCGHARASGSYCTHHSIRAHQGEIE